MKLIKITTATEEGSKIWGGDTMSQYVIQTNRQDVMLITQHTFLNCQNFTVGNGQILNKLDESNIKEFFKKVNSVTSKKIMILDIKSINKVKKIQSKLKPYYKKFYRRKYISTNGSEMYIYHVYLKPNDY